MKEQKPENIQIRLLLKTNTSHYKGTEISAGHITQWFTGGSIPDGYILPEGQVLNKAEYSELSGVFGDTFNFSFVVEDLPWWKTLLNSLKLKNYPIGEMKRNCGEDEFRIPDFRSQFILGRSM